VTVTRRTIKGEKYWVIDRRFRTPDGHEERYRRVAQVQSKLAGEAEERRIIEYWTAHGTIKPLLAVEPPPKVELVKQHTWSEAVAYWREHVKPAKKRSTGEGYERLLDGPGFKFWSADRPLIEISHAEIVKWEGTLASSGLSPSSRRNHHITLRAVLGAVGPHGGEAGVMLAALPHYPPLPKVGRKRPQAASAADLHLILNEGRTAPIKYCQMRAVRASQLAFALAAYAGLRAAEVRGLRARDVDLEHGMITVREARIYGEITAPKSGHERTVAIAAPLHRLLEERFAAKPKPDDLIAAKANGEAWGDTGLWQSLQRACKRLGIEGGRVHALRHFFASALFGGGVDARTVQEMLGHQDLTTTQRYAHCDVSRSKAAISVFV